MTPSPKVGKRQLPEWLTTCERIVIVNIAWGRSSGGERLLGMEEVGGSNPPGSTRNDEPTHEYHARAFCICGGIGRFTPNIEER